MCLILGTEKLTATSHCHLLGRLYNEANGLD